MNFDEINFKKFRIWEFFMLPIFQHLISLNIAVNFEIPISGILWENLEDMKYKNCDNRQFLNQHNLFFYFKTFFTLWQVEVALPPLTYPTQILLFFSSELLDRK